MGRGPLSVVTPYELTFKTDKIRLMHMLEQHIDVEQPQLDLCTVHLSVMAMLCFKSLVELPGSFGKQAHRVFYVLPESNRVDSGTKTRIQRVFHQSICECIMSKGPSTKIPRDWKGFLSMAYIRQKSWSWFRLNGRRVTAQVSSVQIDGPLLTIHSQTFPQFKRRQIRNKTECFICFLYKRSKYPNVYKLRRDICLGRF